MALTNVTTNSLTGAGGIPVTITSGAGNYRSCIAVITTARSPLTASGATLDGVVGTVVCSVNSIANVERTYIVQWLDADMPAVGGVYTLVATLDQGSMTYSVYTADGFAQTAASDFATYNTTTQDPIITLAGAGTDALVIGGLIRNLGTGSLTVGASQTVLLADISYGSNRSISSYSTTINTQDYHSSSLQDLAMAAASFDVQVGPAVETPPTVIRNTVSAAVVVSGSAVAPTTGNTTVQFDNASGPLASNISVSGAGPYTINFTFPLATPKLFDSVTGYPIYIVIAAENVTSAAIPYTPPTGWDYVDVDTPLATTGYLASGYTPAVATGDQVVHHSTTVLEAKTVLIDANTLVNFIPNVATDRFNFYFIDATDNSVGPTDTYTLMIITSLPTTRRYSQYGRYGKYSKY